MSDAPQPGLKRSFVLPGVVLSVLEVLVIVLPVFPLLQIAEDQRGVMGRASLPIVVGMEVLWLAALGSFLVPVRRLISARRSGTVPAATADAAYWALGALPMAALWLRTALLTAAAGAVSAALLRYGDFTPLRAATFTALVGLHALVVSTLRAAWYARVTNRIRGPLFPAIEPLKQFADRWRRRIALVATLIGAASVGAYEAFVVYFAPLRPEELAWVLLALPGVTVVLAAAWVIYVRRAARPIQAYLDWQLVSPTGESSGAADPRAVAAYRAAQSLPYRLGAAKVLGWTIAALGLSALARFALRLEVDNAILLLGAAVVISIGAALYEALWHRETMRPLLLHVSVRHRLPVRDIRTPLSLRAKLLVSFGGLVLFACGLSLFWAYIQYKTLVTTSVRREAQLKLDWVRSEAQVRQRQGQRGEDAVRKILEQAAAASVAEGTVFVYVPPDGVRTMVLGGGQAGAPRLPWYAAVAMRTRAQGGLELGGLGLMGPFQRIVIDDTVVGAVAVLAPGTRGGGPGIQRPLKELLLFFLVLFSACAGIVLLTVSEFTTPIRQLEQRADEMARGELARAVTSGGEGDEVGRLTFALEEMRRALRDKIRSTEEVNLDLEREVQRRTADLARKNRELAEALAKLTRAQSQLVRAEKMASIGQLVAGIAHEINNPVNAIANTVGPLREVISHISSTDEDKADVADMMRVIQNGARRTKEIVQALHNYSRADDERIVDFDLERSLDDSLELLRHHLKGAVEVDRHYGSVGRVRGHAGQLNQVFMNLLTNAAQALAGQEGAHIDVVTRRDGEQALIEVADNGPGIPEEILPRIFDPFFTTKEVGQGSGLGLSIVHGIVERHGGTIEVDSALGRGTKFTVTIPLVGPAGR
jgi:signal transduction histidine kinase